MNEFKLRRRFPGRAGSEAVESDAIVSDAIGRFVALLLAASVLLALYPGPASAQAAAFPALEGKVLFGYQAWFGCPGSWGGGWSHWSGGTPSAANIQVDMYPDLREFDKADLCQVPALSVGGSPAYFFSSRNPKVVDMHFKWMKDYGLDGVLIQRFLADIPGLKRAGDVPLKNILAASAKHGRAIAIEYDVTGASFSTWSRDLQADWKYLVDEIKITTNPTYIHHKGRPLVSVWGVGLNESRNPPENPAECKALLDWFHGTAPEAHRASVMGGVPSGFRTLNRDARTAPAWLDVYKAMDVVQPWNIGRYSTLSQIRGSFAPTVAADRKWLSDAGVLYMPSTFPGYSFFNASRGQKRQNEIPRMGGNFIWQQAMAAKAAGAAAVKIAMFDEVNEATAMFKLVSKRSESPSAPYWLALDGDGMDLPSDWYLRLAGEITKVVNGTRAPTDTIPISPRGGSGVDVRLASPIRSGSGALRWRSTADGVLFESGAGSGAEPVTLAIRGPGGALIRSVPIRQGRAHWDLRDEGMALVGKGLFIAQVFGGKSGKEVQGAAIVIRP